MNGTTHFLAAVLEEETGQQMVLQLRGRFLLVVAAPDMKLTRPSLRTKEYC